MDLNNARELVKATLRKRKLESDLRDTIEQIKGLEKKVLLDMAEDGLPGVKILVANKRWSLSSRTELYVKKKPGVESDDVVRALRASKLGEFVHETYNSQQLSAWARERLGVEKKQLPKALSAVVIEDTRVSVGVVASTKKASMSEVAVETAAIARDD